jgi:hypothetical protein
VVLLSGGTSSAPATFVPPEPPRRPGIAAHGVALAGQADLPGGESGQAVVILPVRLGDLHVPRVRGPVIRAFAGLPPEQRQP